MQGVQDENGKDRRFGSPVSMVMPIVSGDWKRRYSLRCRSWVIAPRVIVMRGLCWNLGWFRVGSEDGLG